MTESNGPSHATLKYFSIKLPWLTSTYLPFPFTPKKYSLHLSRSWWVRDHKYMLWLQMKTRSWVFMDFVRLIKKSRKSNYWYANTGDMGFFTKLVEILYEVKHINKSCYFKKMYSVHPLLSISSPWVCQYTFNKVWWRAELMNTNNKRGKVKIGKAFFQLNG